MNLDWLLPQVIYLPFVQKKFYIIIGTDFPDVQYTTAMIVNV